jgi:hypothetical protein
MQMVATALEIPIIVTIIIGPSDSMMGMDFGAGPYHSADANQFKPMLSGYDFVDSN